MASVVINGDTSGAITVAAPAVAGTNTLTLPAATDTLVGKATTDTLTNKTLTNPSIDSVNGGQLAGMRNLIINGAMEIAQRGTSFAAAADGAYGLDRFLIGRTGAAVATISQDTASVPSSNEFNYALKVAITTADTSIAAGDFFHVGQKIEGYNVRNLIGKDFTLSFWVKSPKTGTHCVAFRNSGTPDRSYVKEYTVNAANTWEQKTISVTGGLITAGTWDWTNGVGLWVTWALASGSTYQTTAGAWQTGNFFATSNQVNCTDSNTNVFALTGVQLEVGSVATPFEHRLFGTELALCQRYYEKSYEIGTNTGSNTGVGSHWFSTASGTANYFSTARFSVIKRGAPTNSIWDIAGNANCASWGNNAATITSNNSQQVPVQYSGATGLVLRLSNGITNAVTAGYHWASDSEL